jgi:hypothetical protein
MSKRKIFGTIFNPQRFKYTLDKKRITWTKNMYPLIEKLIKCTVQLKWKDYEYHGPSVLKILFTNNEESPDEAFTASNYVAASYNTIIHIEDGIEYEKGIDYHIVGGSCYELLNNIYNDLELSDFMDPTGDIDAKCFSPIMLKEHYNKLSDVILKKYDKNPLGMYDGFNFQVIHNGRLNPYLDAILKFIYDGLIEQMEIEDILKYQPKNTVPFDIDEYDDIPAEYKKPELGYRYKKIGNMYITSFLDTSPERQDGNGMIRVQIIAKVVENGVEIIDHILEIIKAYNYEESYRMNEKMGSDDINVLNIPSIGQIPIQSFSLLIEGTLDSYINRLQLVDLTDTRYFHKGINHIGRLIYIYELLTRYLLSPETNRTQLEALNPLTIKGPNGKINKYLESVMYQSNYDLKRFIKKHKTLIFKYFKVNPRTKQIEVVNMSIVDIVIAYFPLFFELAKYPPQGSVSFMSITEIIRVGLPELYKKIYELQTKIEILNKEILDESLQKRDSILKVVHQNKAYTYLKTLNLNRRLSTHKLKSRGSKKNYRSRTHYKKKSKRSRPVEYRS